jgi:hypothetical protein
VLYNNNNNSELGVAHLKKKEGTLAYYDAIYLTLEWFLLVY